MNPHSVVQIAQQAIIAIISVSFPLLAVALVVGTVISLFQTVTQIQEQTLTFVPKFIAILLTLLLMVNWMSKVLILFTTHLLENIPSYVG